MSSRSARLKKPLVLLPGGDLEYLSNSSGPQDTTLTSLQETYDYQRFYSSIVRSSPSSSHSSDDNTTATNSSVELEDREVEFNLTSKKFKTGVWIRSSNLTAKQPKVFTNNPQAAVFVPTVTRRSDLDDEIPELILQAASICTQESFPLDGASFKPILHQFAAKEISPASASSMLNPTALDFAPPTHIQLSLNPKAADSSTQENPSVTASSAMHLAALDFAPWSGTMPLLNPKAAEFYSQKAVPPSLNPESVNFIPSAIKQAPIHQSGISSLFNPEVDDFHPRQVSSISFNPQAADFVQGPSKKSAFDPEAASFTSSAKPRYDMPKPSREELLQTCRGRVLMKATPWPMPITIAGIGQDWVEQRFFELAISEYIEVEFDGLGLNSAPLTEVNDEDFNDIAELEAALTKPPPVFVAIPDMSVPPSGLVSMPPLQKDLWLVTSISIRAVDESEVEVSDTPLLQSTPALPKQLTLNTGEILTLPQGTIPCEPGLENRSQKVKSRIHAKSPLSQCVTLEYDLVIAPSPPEASIRVEEPQVVETQVVEPQIDETLRRLRELDTLDDWSDDVEAEDNSTHSTNEPQKKVEPRKVADSVVEAGAASVAKDNRAEKIASGIVRPDSPASSPIVSEQTTADAGLGQVTLNDGTVVSKLAQVAAPTDSPAESIELRHQEWISSNHWDKEAENTTVHHFSYFGHAVKTKSDTPPAVSLTIILGTPNYQHADPVPGRNLHKALLIWSAMLYVDPVVFRGESNVLSLKGSELQNAATGSCAKPYSDYGLWQKDQYGEEEDHPEWDPLRPQQYEAQEVVANGVTSNPDIPVRFDHILAVSSREDSIKQMVQDAIKLRRAVGPARSGLSWCATIGYEDDAPLVIVDQYVPAKSVQNDVVAPEIVASGEPRQDDLTGMLNDVKPVDDTTRSVVISCVIQPLAIRKKSTSTLLDSPLASPTSEASNTVLEETKSETGQSDDESLFDNNNEHHVQRFDIDANPEARSASPSLSPSLSPSSSEGELEQSIENYEKFSPLSNEQLDDVGVKQSCIIEEAAVATSSTQPMAPSTELAPKLVETNNLPLAESFTSTLAFRPPPTNKFGLPRSCPVRVPIQLAPKSNHSSKIPVRSPLKLPRSPSAEDLRALDEALNGSDTNANARQLRPTITTEMSEGIKTLDKKLPSDGKRRSTYNNNKLTNYRKSPLPKIELIDEGREFVAENEFLTSPEKSMDYLKDLGRKFNDKPAEAAQEKSDLTRLVDASCRSASKSYTPLSLPSRPATPPPAQSGFVVRDAKDGDDDDVFTPSPESEASSPVERPESNTPTSMRQGHIPHQLDVMDDESENEDGDNETGLSTILDESHVGDESNIAERPQTPAVAPEPTSPQPQPPSPAAAASNNEELEEEEDAGSSLSITSGQSPLPATAPKPVYKDRISSGAWLSGSLPTTTSEDEPSALIEAQPPSPPSLWPAPLKIPARSSSLLFAATRSMPPLLKPTPVTPATTNVIGLRHTPPSARPSSSIMSQIIANYPAFSSSQPQYHDPSFEFFSAVHLAATHQSDEQPATPTGFITGIRGTTSVRKAFYPAFAAEGREWSPVGSVRYNSEPVERCEHAILETFSPCRSLAVKETEAVTSTTKLTDAVGEINTPRRPQQQAKDVPFVTTRTRHGRRYQQSRISSWIHSGIDNKLQKKSRKLSGKTADNTSTPASATSASVAAGVKSNSGLLEGSKKYGKKEKKEKKGEPKKKGFFTKVKKMLGLTNTKKE